MKSFCYLIISLLLTSPAFAIQSGKLPAPNPAMIGNGPFHRLGVVTNGVDLLAVAYSYEEHFGPAEQHARVIILIQSAQRRDILAYKAYDAIKTHPSNGVDMLSANFKLQSVQYVKDAKGQEVPTVFYRDAQGALVSTKSPIPMDYISADSCGPLILSY